MAILRMDHVGVVVDDLDAATAFFTELGLEREGGGSVGDERVDRIVGLDGVQADIAMLRVPDGPRCLELVRFRSPEAEGGGYLPSNFRGLRHLCFAVDDVDAALAALRPHGGELVGEIVTYGDSYRLCYVRGPASVIVELAEAVG